ncbi:MAG: DUF4274 domain-containing protein, partial [Methylobacteriaceae bacterium]|nr:DUF4274 domain-containing protein [Methylobacteriaceae bacterium]
MNRLIQWLKKKGPVEWHEVAYTYNWDYDLKPLMWIASQAECDRSTAQMLFLRAIPEEFLVYSSQEEAGNDQAFTLCRIIVERWNAGLYHSNRFPSSEDFNDISNLEHYRDVEQTVIDEYGDVPWEAPDEIFFRLGGRKRIIDFSEYPGGYPEEVMDPNFDIKA